MADTKHPLAEQRIGQGDLETLIRTVIREELRAVMRELLPSIQRPAAQDEQTQALVGQQAREPQPGNNVLWDIHATSTFLGVSTSWLYHAAAAGAVPCIRVGHNLRFDPDALRAWTRGERRGGRVVPLK